MTTDVCPDMLALIVRAADGSLDEQGSHLLAAHTSTCATCREALASQVLVHDLLAAPRSVATSAGFTARVMAALGRESWMEVFDFRRWTWRLAPVAAAVAVAAYAVLGSARARSAGTSAIVPDVPVASALMSDAVDQHELVSLMLFASPDESLTSALKADAR